MRICRVFRLLACAAVLLGSSRTVGAQAQEPSRVGLIEQTQAEKVKTLHPYPVSTGERIMNKVEDIIVGGGLHWHPFLENAYRGGGFALGVGYMHHVSPYNLLDVRGSDSIRNYRRTEVEFMAPRMFHRRGLDALRQHDGRDEGDLDHREHDDNPRGTAGTPDGAGQLHSGRSLCVD